MEEDEVENQKDCLKSDLKKIYRKATKQIEECEITEEKSTPKEEKSQR